MPDYLVDISIFFTHYPTHIPMFKVYTLILLFLYLLFVIADEVDDHPIFFIDLDGNIYNKNQFIKRIFSVYK